MTVESAVSVPDPWCTAAKHGDDHAAYQAGCKCTAARHAAARYAKERTLDALRGKPRLIDATGTRRRLQAMARLGWTWEELGRRIGVRGEAVRFWACRDQVRRTTADRVAALYDKLSMTPPPQRTHRERQIASRQRNRAEALGWQTALVWDDDTIDDPKARPRLGAKQGTAYVDEAAVLRLVEDGKRVKHLSHDEAQLAYDLLRERGFSDHRIEDDYGLKAERYVKRRPILADTQDEWESAS